MNKKQTEAHERMLQEAQRTLLETTPSWETSNGKRVCLQCSFIAIYITDEIMHDLRHEKSYILREANS